MKTKVIAVVGGTLTTLFPGVIAFVILNNIYRSNLPLLQTGLAALLCSLVGGYVAARLGQRAGTRLGALGGLAAGLVVVAVASNLAVITIWAGTALIALWAVGGGLGACVTRICLLRR